MATLLLQAAGAFLGGAFGAVGGAIGTAAGALIGNIIDTNLLNSTRSIEGARLNSHQAFNADEGVPIQRLYGTARLSSTMIWLTRYEEMRNTTREGGKGGLGGGTKVTNYTYFANVAFAICEGEVAGLKRTWIDGREVDLSNYEYRFYRGTETQLADPLIEAKQGAGNCPSYRGICYIVFERFPLEHFGNRIPQFQFEVMRPIGQVERETKAITIIPGATEFGYMPNAVREVRANGEEHFLNRAAYYGASDWAASLDELQALCPNLERIALVVPWFGSDLRAGECLIEPRTVSSSLQADHPWQVAGLTRMEAKQVSKIGGDAAYGGTPSDASVIAAIQDIKNRGLKVTFYPFIMMDVPAQNGLPSPYGESDQPVYPWRGRITCHPAPSRPNSADQTNAAGTQIAAFLGAETDWRYARFIRHYADLCAQAGGVDAFLIGSELRGLTQVRDAGGQFPFVVGLKSLASVARTALGSSTKITYAADWSEYFGYHPQDGSGNVYYHLDPLWADSNIDAIGIDNYMPLTDRRDDGLFAADETAMIASGEGYDWYYASAEDRQNKLRSPITDGAYDKPWVFRYKDIENWWRQPHFERLAGVETTTPTAWVPESKPIWFTELGCPAVDKGANQPNVFPDPKSSENAMPYFSNGRSDPSEQAQFIRAHFDHWSTQNPASSITGQPMIDMDHCYLWAWDARPFPAFPLRQDLWSDGANFAHGHWLNSRFGSVMLDELITHLCAEYGLDVPNTQRVRGNISGLAVSSPQQLRAILEPILTVYGIQPREGDHQVAFAQMGERQHAPMAIEAWVLAPNGSSHDYQRTTEQTRVNEAVISISDPLKDYAPATLRSYEPDGRIARQQKFSLPIAITRMQAQYLVDDWLAQQSNLAQQVIFQWPIDQGSLSLGDHILVPLSDKLNDLTEGQSSELQHIFEVAHIDYAEVQTITAVAADPFYRTQTITSGTENPAVSGPIAGTLKPVILDLPMLPTSSNVYENVKVAGHALPWRQIGYAIADDSNTVANIVDCPATMGTLATALEPTRVTSRYLPNASFDVQLNFGAFETITQMRMLSGANALAIGTAETGWEIVQFLSATEIDLGLWRLSDIIRGQAGTEHMAALGHQVGADCVLIDACVQPLSTETQLSGGASEWIFYPSGEPYDRDTALRLPFDGAPEAAIALPPVHLKMWPEGQNQQLSWVRRGRIDADRWDQAEIPLGEISESYRLTLQNSAGEQLISTSANQQSHSIANDVLISLGVQPGDWLTLSVGQVGASLDEVRMASQIVQFLQPHS